MRIKIRACCRFVFISAEGHFIDPVRQKECGLVIPNERLITTLGDKMAFSRDENEMATRPMLIQLNTSFATFELE